MFSSQKTNWKTPRKFYLELNREFHFTFDPCPSKRKKGFDGLTKKKWGKRNFVNPPYHSKRIWNWLVKAITEKYKFNTLSVFLLPARTDTKWFHELVLNNASEIRFIKGRLKFSGQKNCAPFQSMIVIF